MLADRFIATLGALLKYTHGAVFGFLLATLVTGFATTRTVNSTADDQGNGCSTAPGGCTLREAIEASLDNDSIDFAASLNGAAIVLRGTELGIVRNLTIIGPPAGLTIDGGSLSRIFNVQAGTVTLSNLTIAGGKVKGVRGVDAPDLTTPAQPGGDEYGGGIRNAGTLTLTNCRVTNNLVYGGNGGNGRSDGRTGTTSFGGAGGAGWGGGIANLGTLTLLNCTVSGNYAYGGSGGITYSIGDNGSAAGGFASGGGIFSSQGGKTLIMMGCTLSGNGATGGPGGNGGAGSYGGDGGAAIGGGLYSNAPTTTLKLCTVSDNEAEGGPGGAGGPSSPTDYWNGDGGYGYGGGIYTSSEFTLLSCTVSDNLARGGLGGGVQAQSNGGSAEGGGLYGYGCAIRNTIIARNSLDGASPSGPDVKGYQSSEGHNFIGNTGDNGDHSVSSGWVASDFTGSLGTPLDPGLGPLQDNGGPTFTRALLSTSAAIDKGDDAVLNAPFNLTTDQRGYLRKVGSAVDIGTFEFDPPQVGPDFVVNTTDEHSDGVCSEGDCSLWDAAGAANANADTNTITFKAGLSGTITTKLQATGINLVYPVTINGPGARTLTISGGDSARIFTVASTATVTITGLTLANGNYGDDGGGILNNGDLTLINCALLNNKADRGTGGGVSNATSKTLTITNCTFANNQAGADGGGVANGAGSVVISNSTFSGNTAGRGGGAVAGTGVTLRSSTITSNHATSPNGISYGGGVSNFSDSDDSIYVSNTVIAGNTATDGPDIFGLINSQDYNLFGNTTGATIDGTTTHNITGVSANLDPLRNNGGPTDTHALRSNSLAINHGNNANAPSRDQRGFGRNGVSDIGAFEFNGIPLRVLSIVRNGNNIVVSFNATKAETYQLERRLNITSAWTNVQGIDPLYASVTATMEFTDMNAISFGEAFYRVRLLP